MPDAQPEGRLPDNLPWLRDAPPGRSAGPSPSAAVLAVVVVDAPVGIGPDGVGVVGGGLLGLRRLDLGALRHPEAHGRPMVVRDAVAVRAPLDLGRTAGLADAGRGGPPK